MNFQFKIQDPSNPDTTYLLEEIIKLIQKGDMTRWRGIYSWTTGKAISRVFIEDPDINEFLKHGQIELIIGIDAITTDYALKKLLELNSEYPNFVPKVFHNDVSDLFHPKISHFEFQSGEQALLVGSGNFTLTGLQTNIEAYTITTGNPQEMDFLSEWDDFLLFHSARIKEIDLETIEIAKKNRIVFARKAREIEEELSEELSGEEEEEITEEAEDIVEMPLAARLGVTSRVLIALVPRAGGRWRQIHYNADVIQQFFHASPDSHQRVFLKEVHFDGSLGPDEFRPVVYSNSNKNLKIEVSARPGIAYPDEGAPIIVLREVGIRNFLYMLILPNDPPYNSLKAFLDDNESVGKGLKRVITDSRRLRAIWDACPLVQQT